MATVDVSKLVVDGDSVCFDYRDAFDRPACGFVIRWQGRLRAYRNRCPHWSMPLDDDTGQFWDDAGRMLVCRWHGARFEPATGACITGPCIGDRLEVLDVELDEDAGLVHISRRSRGLSF